MAYTYLLKHKPQQINNIMLFCNQHNLNSQHLRAVARKERKHHKHFTAVKS